MARRSIVRGDDTTLTCQFDETLAGYSGILTIRATIEDRVAALTSTCILDSTGLAVFLLDHAQTSRLPVQNMIADIQLTSPEGLISTLIPEGNEPGDPRFQIRVFADVTR